MDLIAKERERLLYRTTRLIGIVLTLSSFLVLGIPGIVDSTSLLAAIILGFLLLFCYIRLAGEHSLLWVLLGLSAGLGVLAIVQFPIEPSDRLALSMALIPFAGGALGAFALVLTSNLWRILVLIAATAASSGLVLLAAGSAPILSHSVAAVILGWIVFTLVGIWTTRSVDRAADRIKSIGRAHQAERQASEKEAQRRQSARLLHDTVLATLTLLAHSGVGVTVEALKAQAGDDARLLRQLRLDAGSDPDDGDAESDVPEKDSATDQTIGTTLESVKHRFNRIGLEVKWHGTGQVLLPGEVLDAFLLALAECLENVRRHAGVSEAHVTITDDDKTVRAMVTDSGVGFDVADVDSARLGLKESVIARLSEVGGTARLFSAPGAGTTVVLEVPK